tara:strand:+ start:2171 stop:2872 length:702 start_codon:yes stop_codon:yes gene_type:complete
MARKIHGDGSLTLQPGASVTDNDDGTIVGTASFIGDANSAAPGLGSGHPYNGSIQATSWQTEGLPNGTVKYTGSYFGVGNDTRRVSYSAGVASEDIQLHPKFDKIAGTPESPKNGATWVKREDELGEEYYEWLGFYNDGEGSRNGDNSLVGVTNYLQPSGTVEVSYYTSRAPKPKRLATIHNTISGFSKPTGVKNFLLTDMPYRQIGRSFYQVTETYLASDEKGWNRNVYAKA